MATEILETSTDEERVPIFSSEIRDGIRQRLDEIRRALFRRIAWEAAIRVGCWVMAWFLIVWALDYVPIWVGASELPVTARAVLLILGVAVAVGIGFWWGWRRFRVPVSDQDLALLLERHAPNLGDRLATAVQFQDPNIRSDTDWVDRDWQSVMLRRATEGLAQDLEHVDIAGLFDWRPVVAWRRILLGLATVSLLLLLIWPQWFAMAIRRELLLDHRRWPRRTNIDLAAIRPMVAPRLTQLLGESPVAEPREGVIRIGTGSDLQLLVDAHSTSASDTAGEDRFVLPNARPLVPGQCSIVYTTSDGLSGRQYMTRFGATSASTEGFRFDGPPFQQIDSPIQLTIYGGDDRIGPIRLQPVENLSLTGLQLNCQFPEYLRKSGGSRWLPRTVTWTQGLQLPVGTRVQAVLEFSRSVERVLILPTDSETISIDWQGEARRDVPVNLGTLMDSWSWEIWACSADRIWTRQAMTFGVQAVTDQPPSVQAHLLGIESAVTPQAILPIECQARDDYGLNRLQAELVLPVAMIDPTLSESIQPADDSLPSSNAPQDGLPREAEGISRIHAPLQAQPMGVAESENAYQTRIDLRDWQQQYQTQASLMVDQQQVIQLRVTATDYFDPSDLQTTAGTSSGQPHVTQSHTINLEVVSPAALLRLLKRSEVGQRQRLEQIHQELMDQRFYLQRSANLIRQTTDDAEVLTGTGDDTSDAESATDSISTQDMAAVFVRRALTQNEKSRQELIGVQQAFQRIVDQIINNRLEAAEYRRRLEVNILQAMDRLTRDFLVQSGQILQQVETVFQESGQRENLTRTFTETEIQSLERQLKRSLDENDRCLKLLDEILRDLMKFETDAELYELVRQLFDNQQRLMNETSRQQQEQAFEDLFGN